MKVLVTGGAGFIGSHTCVELLNAGCDVVVIDNFCNSQPEIIENVRKITGKAVHLYENDLRNPQAVSRIFAEHTIDVVIHFAGLKAVAESIGQPLNYYGNNLEGTLTLLGAMQQAGCKRLIFSSSATVYGIGNPVPFKEGMPVCATTPYGSTKIMIEQILTDLAAADPQWHICLLRYFNPGGAHPSGLIGEDPSGVPNNLLPYVSQVAAGLRSKILVYGDDYNTPDGTGVRDYIHVVDLAQGHLAAIAYVQDGKMGGGIASFNLGTGKGTSVLEIIKAYSDACGRQLPYQIVGRRSGDIPVCYADPQKAAQILGWKARRDIAQMCADSWNFARRRYGEMAAVHSPAVRAV